MSSRLPQTAIALPVPGKVRPTIWDYTEFPWKPETTKRRQELGVRARGLFTHVLLGFLLEA